LSLSSHIKGKTPIGLFLLDSIIIPKLPPSAIEEPSIKHQGKRWGLIGTAFDYLVRMSLASREGVGFVPKIAIIAIEKYLSRSECTAARNALITGIGCKCKDCQHYDNWMICADVAIEAVKNNNIRKMAAKSLSLARLDGFHRPPHVWDNEWFSKESDSDDIRELLELHELWSRCFELPKGKLLFNPSFDSSPLLGGADADLIVDQTIIDWKVVNVPNRELRTHLAQLLGYSLLSNLDGKPLETFTLYFARHGVQFSLPFSEIINRNIDETQSLFIDLLKDTGAV